MDIWYLNAPNHGLKDVVPYKVHSLERYHAEWTPNNDNQCPINIKNK